MQVIEARLVPNTLLACATVLIYDWLCTLNQEISHVRARPWSTGTLFFVLNRYLPFIDVFISLSAKLTRISPECLTRIKIVAWLNTFGIFLSEVILMLRTYALWERKRAVLISMAILCICTVIPTAVFVQLELGSLEYVPTDGVGCALARASSIIVFAYLMLMISETTIVVLTAIKAYQASISLANILVPILAPSMFSNWFATPQRVLHSVLCTRVLLLIRKPLVRRTGFRDSITVSINDTGVIFASAGYVNGSPR
ncbi:hypothetical protein C8R44DRAFT_979272 [Mycena epipterygia]|nr:hypothetical protein C8R44DRAFT_979272 [Mycena epipterygia]